MKAYFCRELNRNYLVITDWNYEKNSYVLSMLEHNTIPGLLPLQVRRSAQGVLLYYGISSRQSIARVFDRGQIGFELMEKLLNHVRETAGILQQYLLDDSGLLLSPEDIYMEPDTGNFALIYVPGGNEEDCPLLSLAEFMLKHLKHSDSKAVALGYGFYQKAGIPHCSLKECLTDTAVSFPEKHPTDQPHRQPLQQRGQPLQTGKPLQNAKELKKGKSPKEASHPSGPKKPQKSNGRAGTSRLRTALALTTLLLFLAGIYGFIIWWFSFDLTQAGGLAFFMIALVWLAGTVIAGKNKKQDSWKWEMPSDQEEEEYLEEVLAQIDREEKEKKQEQKQGQKPEQKQEQKQEEDYKTRYIGSGDESVLLLKSTEPDFYGDLVIRESSVQIGKKGGGADLLLPSDAVSRMHACLENTQAGWQVTDLNSMNGTYINDMQLQPNETRILREGDRLRFADLTYRYCIVQSNP